MGEVEIEGNRLVIRANIITYGTASDPTVTTLIAQEIEQLWNEPGGIANIHRQVMRVEFRIESRYAPGITPEEIIQNVDPRNNYFRIESFAEGNISFVDGIPSNTGYFLLENLYAGSTTAAHEYGHTIGLEHPHDLDYRGRGRPGIMYPRGTLVDPQFQYDATKPAGQTGGTLHPMHRRVLQSDIDDLKLGRLSFQGSKAILGWFTSVYHEAHSKG